VLETIAEVDRRTYLDPLFKRNGAVPRRVPQRRAAVQFWAGGAAKRATGVVLVGSQQPGPTFSSLVQPFACSFRALKGLYCTPIALA
jgi:hypothetical protein